MIFDLIVLAFGLGIVAGVWLTLKVGPVLMGEHWPDHPARPFDWGRDAPEFGVPRNGHVRRVHSYRDRTYPSARRGWH